MSKQREIETDHRALEVIESEHLTTAPVLGPWRHDCRIAEWKAFADAAFEAANYANGLTILPEGEDVAVAFRGDFFVRYVGGAEGPQGPQGCGYYGFLFSMPGKLEVIAWVEDDGIHARVVWRGDQADFERAAVDMTMFAGAWLPELNYAA